MTGVLKGYEPRAMWEYFEEICGIPHGSGNTKAISDYLVAFADAHGFYREQDELNNVIIVREASEGLENKEPIILQGHIDMVAEKRPGSSIDMEKEGLSLYVENGYLKARDTTLGADDGIAIAMGMALLADETPKAPRLELVCTVDEETGMGGALGIDCSVLKGRRMVNIDSEEEGVITAGCAGGVVVRGEIPFDTEKAFGKAYRITIHGLKGGHSGEDINKNRNNSNMVLGRFLFELNKKLDLRFSTMAGGSKDNVIPRHTEGVVVLTDSEGEEVLFRESLAIRDRIRKEYSGSDEGLEITFEETHLPPTMFTAASQREINRMLINLPNGVVKMSGEIEGLVETSLNLGIMKAEDGVLRLSCSLRSSKGEAKEYLKERIINYLTSFGGECICEGEYPGWDFARESKLRDTVLELGREILGRELKVAAFHAGLECGVFAGKIQGLDCVSIGPEINYIHTTEEELNIASAERCYRRVRAVIEKM